MAFERKEFDELQERRRSEKVKDSALHLRQLAQAEVLATQLTGRSEWDAFIQIIQGMVEEAKVEAQSESDQLGSPNLIDHQEMLRHKIRLLELREAIRIMEHLIGLPKVLCENGRAARKLMKEYGVER